MNQDNNLNNQFNQNNFNSQGNNGMFNNQNTYQNLNMNINQQVNHSMYSCNQNPNNHNVGNQKKQNKIRIVIIVSVIIILFVGVLVVFLSPNKDNSDVNNNVLNNNDKIEYSEVIDNFGFYDNKYVFTASDNVTLDTISDNFPYSFYFGLKVNYESQLYEQIVVSIYDSYDDFKFNDSDVEYIINHDNEIFFVIKKEDKITFALYGYVYGDDFITLSFNNNNSDYIDVKLDNMKTIFNLCKSTIDLNNNNNLSIVEKTRKYYLYNEYKIKDDYVAQNISKNGFQLNHLDKNVEYEISITFEKESESSYWETISTIDNFVIKLTSGDIVDSYVDIFASMEKNGQKIHFHIRRWNSDDKVTTNDIYELFNVVFEK